MADGDGSFRGSFNLSNLAGHLSVDRSSIGEIVDRAGLKSLYGLFPWNRVLSHIHGIDQSQLHACYSKLIETHGAALPSFSDFEKELRRPLLSFEEMAARLGKRPDTLAKAIRQGRLQLPFQTITLGPRLRRFRPFDVDLWVDREISVHLPAPTLSGKPEHSRMSEVLGRIEGVQKQILSNGGGDRNKKEVLHNKSLKAVFGTFSRSSRQLLDSRK